MVPVGMHPIIWHVMQYYRFYGHRDFVLCLGHKANVIKDYFLNYRPTTDRDFVVSGYGKEVRMMGPDPGEWEVTLVDTGIWRNIGQRLRKIRPLIGNDPVFLANYSDGLTDAPLPEMLELFYSQGKIGCFLAVHPSFSFHLVDFNEKGNVSTIRTTQESEIWINAGFFIFRREIFDYIEEGEDLVAEPFRRLIEAGQLVAYKHRGFWAAMDTLKDKKDLEDMVERGQTPWLPWIKTQS